MTRQIFAGAGKVLQTPRGFHYCLSQRAQHICQEISGATTSSRSIINTRDEPHADAEKYRRLHVIVGDSNMSEVATYLKVGTTALILDMIEDGHFDRDYSLQSPVQAIRDISHDPTLRETIRLKDGRAITPLQLQMEYLEHATRYVQAIDADPVTRDVLARWTYVIEQLADDPMQLNREVDWVIKQQLHPGLHGEEPSVLAGPEGLAHGPPVPRHPARQGPLLQSGTSRPGGPHHRR